MASIRFADKLGPGRLQIRRDEKAMERDGGVKNIHLNMSPKENRERGGRLEGPTSRKSGTATYSVTYSHAAILI